VARGNGASRLREAFRRLACAREHRLRIFAPRIVHDHGQHFREVAGLGAETIITEASAVAAASDAQARDDLVGFETSFQGFGGQIGGRDAARAADTAHLNLSGKRNHDRRPIGRRIGMSKAAADGAAVAHGAIGNLACRALEHALEHRGHAAILELCMAHAGAHDHMAGLLRAPAQLLQARNVDEQAWRGEPQVEHRPERLAAGNDFRAGIVREQPQRGLQTCRPLVIELGNFRVAVRYGICSGAHEIVQPQFMRLSPELACKRIDDRLVAEWPAD
jgi:hypothetical protein